jgi:hypothetical protein
MRNAYKIFGRKSTNDKSYDNNKMNLREMLRKHLDWVKVAQNVSMKGFSERSNEHLGSIKAGYFLTSSQLLKQDNGVSYAVVLLRSLVWP